MFKAIVIAMVLLFSGAAQAMDQYDLDQIVWYQYYGEWSKDTAQADTHNPATKKAVDEERKGSNGAKADVR